ncbi:MAG: DUF5685 family protein [bacterium]|nr:DUF5685 family protein [bacterium]
MFGYITIAPGTLAPERQERYRAHYCGLCRTLGTRFGAVGQMTLSYDVTFLYLLLSSLYEPEEQAGTERCVPHPFKPHGYVLNELADYCCDMNIALAYHKCMDDWQDDSSLIGRGEAALLRKGYLEVQKRYPEKCRQIEKCLQELHQLEVRKDATLDDAANLSARMLGILYRYQEDLWADTLERMGQALGRFIYLMDAYDDLDKDMRKNRFNALRHYRSQPDYEAFVKESLTLLIAECTDAFETLPLVQDMDILRNILYAGCWTRYQQKQLKRERKNGTPDRRKEDGA